MPGERREQRGGAADAVHEIGGRRLDGEHPGRVPQQRRRGAGVPHAQPGQRQPVAAGHGPAGPPGVEQHVGQGDRAEREDAGRLRAAEIRQPVQALGEHLVGVVLFAEQSPAEQGRGRGGGVVWSRRAAVRRRAGATARAEATLRGSG